MEAKMVIAFYKDMEMVVRKKSKLKAEGKKKRR
jgi:hypothetical protein